MAALSTLAPLADRAMKNAGTDFTALRQIHIGRLELEVVGATRPFKRNWERVDSVGGRYGAGLVFRRPVTSCDCAQGSSEVRQLHILRRILQP